MKRITLKIEFELPNGFKYYAQDASGEVYVYTEMPLIDDEYNSFYSFNNSPMISIAKGAPNPDWKGSLRELREI